MVIICIDRYVNACESPRGTAAFARWEHFAGECFLWLVPTAAALFGNAYGGAKATLPRAGPGLHLALWNDRTEMAVEHWRYFANMPWVFALYGGVLICTFLFA